MAAAAVTLRPSRAWPRSISYLTWTLSRARKNGLPRLNTAALTASGLEWARPEASSAARLLWSLIVSLPAAGRAPAAPEA